MEVEAEAGEAVELTKRAMRQAWWRELFFSSSDVQTATKMRLAGFFQGQEREGTPGRRTAAKRQKSRHRFNAVDNSQQVAGMMLFSGFGW